MRISGILIILLLLIGAVVIAGYCFYYRLSINKSLHSDSPKKRLPPKDIIMIVLVIISMIAIGFIIVKSVKDHSSPAQKDFFNYTQEDLRGAMFDSLFDDEDLALQRGYRLSVERENGFEVRVLEGDRLASSIPNYIIRLRYVEELPTLAEGEVIDFKFEFLCRDDKQPNAEFMGHGFEGEYRQIYITYDFYGRYNMQLAAELRIRTNKVDEVEPFAKAIFEIGAEQI